jgi:hypothetical protein
VADWPVDLEKIAPQAKLIFAGEPPFDFGPAPPRFAQRRSGSRRRQNPLLHPVAKAQERPIQDTWKRSVVLYGREAVQKRMFSRGHSRRLASAQGEVFGQAESERPETCALSEQVSRFRDRSGKILRMPT